MGKEFFIPAKVCIKEVLGMEMLMDRGRTLIGYLIQLIRECGVGEIW
jgi:hypothetical protein